MRVLVLPLVALVVSSAASGSARTRHDGPKWPAPAAARPAELPPPGKVRIIAQKVNHGSRVLHWRWRIVGDRDWRQGKTSPHELVLSGSHPKRGAALTPADRAREGVFEWHHIITATKGARGMVDMVHRQALLQPFRLGGRGQGLLVRGAKGMSVEDVLEVQGPKERLVTLPADVVLGTLKGSIDGRSFQNTLRLRIAK
jgi:hypothetical protein